MMDRPSATGRKAWVEYADWLEAELDNLREAISNHKLKLNATAAIPTSIDRELWAALDREIVYQTEDEIPVDRAGRKMFNKFGDKLDIEER
jgi:hypothetical protein